MQIKIKKIIFLFDYPFDQRDYTRYAIEYLISRGLQIELWDVTKIFQKTIAESNFVSECINTQQTLKFNCIDTVKQQISAINSANCIIINQLPYNKQTYPLYRLISKLKIYYCLLRPNAIPFEKEFVKNCNVKYINIDRLVKFKKLLNPKFVVSYCRFNRYFHHRKIKPATFLILGGEKSFTPMFLIDDSTKLFWIHSFDYDIYLRSLINKSKSNLSAERKCVFLDEYLAFHPDYVYLKLQPYVTAEDYYPKLCYFFELIEKKFNVRVVIAAHPRAQYENLPDYFNGREVVRGNTCEFVRQSEFVIGHASTSLSFAVLYYKPIFLIQTKELKSSAEGEWIENFSNALNRKIFNIEDCMQVDYENELAIDREKYDAYISNFIKTKKSPSGFFWEVFVNNIEKI